MSAVVFHPDDHESPTGSGGAPSPAGAGRSSVRDPCVRFSDSRSILEIESHAPESTGQPHASIIRLQVRIRAQGMLAQTDLICDVSAMGIFRDALFRLGHISQEIARLEGLGAPSPALIVGQQHAVAPAELTILGLTRDPRVRFVVQNWQLSDADLVRLREWCSHSLQPTDIDTSQRPSHQP